MNIEKSKPYEPSEEEIKQNTKERILSDAELIGNIRKVADSEDSEKIKGEGAEYVIDKNAKKPRLEVTNEQRREKLVEMTLDIDTKTHWKKLIEFIKNNKIKEGTQMGIRYTDKSKSGDTDLIFVSQKEEGIVVKKLYNLTPKYIKFEEIDEIFK